MLPKNFRVHEGKVGRVDYELEVCSLVLGRAVHLDIDVIRSWPWYLFPSTYVDFRYLEMNDAR